MNSKGNTIFWAIIACLLWSTAYAGIKLGLKYDTPFHFSGIRFIISGLIILPFTVKPSTFIGMIIENWKVVAWVTFLQIVVNYSLFYHGLSLVPGALGAVVYGAQPLIIAVVAAVIHKDDKLTRKKILTILFGISGVILISAGRQAFKLGTALELLGIVMILVANAATGISIITPVSGAGLSWMLIPDEHPEWLTISGMIIITISLIIYYTNNKEETTVLNN